MDKYRQPRIPIDETQLSEFCRKWQITEFALFGSVLRDDFGPDSDVDVLVTFAPNTPWSLLDVVSMIDELKVMFGREVDLVENGAIRNPFRRHSILSTKEIVYAA